MIRKILILFLLIAAVSSCEHKDLCLYHHDHAFQYHVMIEADYRLEWEENMTDYMDWESNWPDNYVEYDSLRPDKPIGLRVVNYPHSIPGGHKTSNVAADGGVVYFSEGTHDILFYNNDTEYILMASTEKFATSRATTSTRTRTTYKGNPFATKSGEEITVNPPDMLYGNFINGYQAQRLEEPDLLKVTLHPLVFTYKIRFEFKSGLEYVSLARGTLAGMARSVNMSTGYTSSEIATILYDCEIKDYGVGAYVNSFGIPGYPNTNYTKAGNVYAVNLECRMKNGKIKSFDFDVTEQVERQPHGGVIIIKDLVVTETEGSTSSGSFDVTVSDWGEYKDIELPL